GVRTTGTRQCAGSVIGAGGGLPGAWNGPPGTSSAAVIVVLGRERLRRLSHGAAFATAETMIKSIRTLPAQNSNLFMSTTSWSVLIAPVVYKAEKTRSTTHGTCGRGNCKSEFLRFRTLLHLCHV